MACDDVPAGPLPATDAATGIDMGVTHFLTTSEGAHVENPRHGKRNAEALADAQRALKAFPRRKRADRPAKHRRAVEKVAGLHRKLRRLGTVVAATWR
ncbi:transposase [Streptomyces sp. NBC_01167]|uniref:transposase n=1 Tax=Streptomyces sp. NBC_01167 TaxID=2903756 RepID=UPI003869D799|nr:transposase [Streptomyces sp. NBC_01167]